MIKGLVLNMSIIPVRVSYHVNISKNSHFTRIAITQWTRVTSCDLHIFRAVPGHNMTFFFIPTYVVSYILVGSRENQL